MSEVELAQPSLPDRSSHLDDIRSNLLSWLHAQGPADPSLSVSNFAPPGNNGFSNETYFFDLDKPGADPEHLVLRLTPRRGAFMEYDLATQFQVIQRLGATNVPVPAALWFEGSADALGGPFYVMERVDGLIASDQPTMHAEGWVKDLTSADQERLWWEAIDVLVRVHAVDWRQLGVKLPGTDFGGRLAGHLDTCETFYRWAIEGLRRTHPTIERALVWLREHDPVDAGRDPVLCWGDARLGNLIFRDGRCVAVLDWEMMLLAQPEADLAWFLWSDTYLSAGMQVPRLPGFPSRDETIAGYEERAGRTMRDLELYEVFAALRASITMIRLVTLMEEASQLPADTGMAFNNPVSAQLEQLLA